MTSFRQGPNGLEYGIPANPPPPPTATLNSIRAKTVAFIEQLNAQAREWSELMAMARALGMSEADIAEYEAGFNRAWNGACWHLAPVLALLPDVFAPICRPDPTDGVRPYVVKLDVEADDVLVITNSDGSVFRRRRVEGGWEDVSS